MIPAIYCLPLLIINQIIKPIIPVISTMINHITPDSPFASASLYTQTAIKIAITIQTAKNIYGINPYCILIYLPFCYLY